MVATARSRLWVIAARMHQTALAPNVSEGWWAQGPSMRSEQTVSQIACCLTEFGHLTPTQWAALDRVFWANDQVFRGVLARRGLAPLYERNGRPFSPPQPELATTDVQPEVLR